ncbi:MAG: hypothetical protein JO108_28990 [Acidobacteriaceae bacterium]|nr:hypothetical protein [Acidobacteriaceae bacterium]
MLNQKMSARLLSLLVVVLQLNYLLAQQPNPVPLNAESQAIKDQLIRIGIGNRFTVRTKKGAEFHGSLQSINAQNFSMSEVDLKSREVILYSDVKKVKKGYGGRTITGQRMSHRKQAIGIAIVAGVFVVLLLVVAVELRKS